MAAFSDYLENKLLDFLLRGQAYTPPTTVYVGLLTSAPTDTGGGTEVTGGSYARASIASSMTNWAGTQSAGSTAASSGSTGTTSNNGVVSFPTPSANWGSVSHIGVYDASTGGNLLFYAALAASKNVNNGDPGPTFAAGSLTVQIDN